MLFIVLPYPLNLTYMFPRRSSISKAALEKSFFAEAAEYTSTGGVPAIHEGIRARHSLTVIADATQLDGVSIDLIRTRFEELVDAHPDGAEVSLSWDKISNFCPGGVSWMIRIESEF